MYFQYGGHRHPDNEVHLVNMEIIPQYSERGNKWANIFRMHLHGEIIETGQDDIHTKIVQLIEAYKVNGQDAGLYHDDGTKTRHFLDNDDPDNLSGNKIEYRSWPSKGTCEYATFRSFQIIIRATFRDLESQILTWRETIRFVGDSGPTWYWVKTPNGQPFPQGRWSVTTQKIIQDGYVLGLDGWPDLGTYAVPVLPSIYEHTDRRVRVQHSPTWSGAQYTRYGWSYTYHFEGPPGLQVNPQLPIV